MEDFELTLYDRIEVIKNINAQYDLENNAYVSFSGGADSVVLHHLIDMALPNNKYLEFILIQELSITILLNL